MKWLHDYRELKLPYEVELDYVTTVVSRSGDWGDKLLTEGSGFANEQTKAFKLGWI